MSTPSLHWLPSDDTWKIRLRSLQIDQLLPEAAFKEATALAKIRLEFPGINNLDRVVQEKFNFEQPECVQTSPVRVAILGTSTTTHLHSSIRIAGLRRGLWVQVYEVNYGQYYQELTDKSSGLHKFRPTVAVFAIDAFALTATLTSKFSNTNSNALLDEAMSHMSDCWKICQTMFSCQIIQHTLLDVFPNILGENEIRLTTSRSTFVSNFNKWLYQVSIENDVDLLSLDRHIRFDGLFAWFRPALWHRSKQEISPPAAPVYGDLVMRLVGAKLGRSFKCLVLDLDNTIWGGVVGDDGVGGIILGQGSAQGEAFVDIQKYALELSSRGIILAICSKNDESNAKEPFNSHPEMLLKLNDIACFVANWHDKATNLRKIASDLSIGLDSIVFLDDNLFERTLVRQELPAVAVPEVEDDPALFSYTISSAGYFESLGLTNEDKARSSQYQENALRYELKSHSTDIESYLKNLDMHLFWKRFDLLGSQRVLQLINKTNQFNLTTRRYTDIEIQSIMADPYALGLQLRLTDRFGDNGIIAVIIGRLVDRNTMELDTWLMSCRVLGRQVEKACLNIVVRLASEMGASIIKGIYIPSGKNSIVKKHYEELGFNAIENASEKRFCFSLTVENYNPIDTVIKTREILP